MDELSWAVSILVGVDQADQPVAVDDVFFSRRRRRNIDTGAGGKLLKTGGDATVLQSPSEKCPVQRTASPAWPLVAVAAGADCGALASCGVETVAAGADCDALTSCGVEAEGGGLWDCLPQPATSSAVAQTSPAHKICRRLDGRAAPQRKLEYVFIFKSNPLAQYGLPEFKKLYPKSVKSTMSRKIGTSLGVSRRFQWS